MQGFALVAMSEVSVQELLSHCSKRDSIMKPQIAAKEVLVSLGSGSGVALE